MLAVPFGGRSTFDHTHTRLMPRGKDHLGSAIRCSIAAMLRHMKDRAMVQRPRQLTSWERAQVDVSKPAEVIGWSNKWRVTPERLKAAVAKVGTSAVKVAQELGKTRLGLNMGH